MDHDRNPLPMETEADLQELGFQCFLSVKDLRLSPRHPDIPTTGGVYLVIRERREYPEFLARGTGGFVNEEDPNVDTSELAKKWVEDALVLYVGQSKDLQTRIYQLIKFGDDNKSPHKGGKYLWQIADAEDFKVYWKKTPNHEQGEAYTLAVFQRAHRNRLPFANLRDA